MDIKFNGLSMIKLLQFLSVTIIVLLFWGCIDPLVTKTNTTKKEIKISFILENSGSMAGFMVGNSQFKENITNLAATIDKISEHTSANPVLQDVQTKNTKDTTFIDSVVVSFLAKDYCTAGSSATFNPIASNAHEFNSMIKSGIATEPTSPIDKILHNAIQNNATGSVTFLVSDFVFDDRSQDCGSLLSGIQGRISTVFNEAAVDTNFAVFIYRFESSFIGPFETCNNSSIMINSRKHPYFVWMMGDRDALELLNKRLENEKDFIPSNVYFLGFGESLVTTDLLMFSNKSGQWSYDKATNSLSNVSSISGQPIKFTIGMDLSHYPKGLIDSLFLSKNLNIETSGIKVHSYKFIGKNSLKPLIDQKDEKTFNSFTHFVEVVFAEPENDFQISIFLTNNQPRWFEDLSTDNDSNPADLESGKTFGIKQFINGVESAFNNSGKKKNLFQINLKSK